MAAEGAGPTVAGVVGVLVATALLTPLLRPVFLAWLNLPVERWVDGMMAVSLRAGLAVVALLTLDIYTAVIRGEERRVLALLPVDPGQVVWTAVVQVAARRWWVLPSAAVVLSPVLVQGAPGLWALGLAVIAGAWAAVATARTPSTARALEVSIERILAWGCWLRRTFPYSRPGRRTSPPYMAAPVTLSTPSWRIGRVPMTRYLPSAV